MKHLPEFLKTKSGLFMARWANILIVIFLSVMCAKNGSPGLYLSLSVFSVSLMFNEINMLANFNLATKKTYINHDRSVWNEIEAMLPPMGGIYFLRRTDFYGRFDSDRFDDIYEYNSTIQADLNKRFQDEELEILRTKFSSSLQLLVNRIGVLTYPHGRLQGVPTEWRDSSDKEMRAKFQTDSELLNEAKNAVLNDYDSLYASVKKKLFAD